MRGGRAEGEMGKVGWMGKGGGGWRRNAIATMMLCYFRKRTN